MTRTEKDVLEERGRKPRNRKVHPDEKSWNQSKISPVQVVAVKEKFGHFDPFESDHDITITCLLYNAI
jgi:hypothetical protein